MLDFLLKTMSRPFKKIWDRVRDYARKSHKKLNATIISTKKKPFFQFKDPTNKFIDEKDYENKKIEETRQEETNDKVNWSKEKIKAFYLWSSTKKKLYEIAEVVKVNPNTMTPWVRDFKKYTQ
jgi:translation elongation factor P/translation initiation factor 5A